MCYHYGIVLIFVTLANAEILNKCCADGEEFYGGDVKCAPVDNNATEYYWLPENYTVASDVIIKYKKQICDVESVMVLYKNYKLATNGMLEVLNDKKELVASFTEKSFCFERYNNRILAYVCPCVEYLCIWKCCTNNRKLHNSLNDMKECRDSTEVPDWHHSLLEGDKITKYHVVLSNMHNCSAKNKVVGQLYGNYKLREDGTIISEKDGEIQASDYCGEYFIDHDNSVKPIILACLDPINLGPDILDIVRVPMLIFGSIFLLITSIIYFSSPEMGDLPRLFVAFHAMTMLMAYICMILNGISHYYPHGICLSIGYIMQFSFLAAFFWLNVMCIDMSWTFSGLRAPNGSRKDRDRKKFMWYSVYGWGGPSLLLILALVFEYASIVPEDSTFKPNVGLIKCWFRDTGALWLFFYGPMAFLLITNMVLFIYTSFRIIVLRRGDGALHQDDSQRHGGRGPSSRDRQRFALYAKLFSLMGISWLTEIISWAVGGSNYIWLFTDSINLLRAFFIFVIFCWKPRVWKSIKSRLACVRKCEQVANRLCCGKILHMDGHNEDQRNTSTTNSIPKETSTKVDGVEMAPA